MCWGLLGTIINHIINIIDGEIEILLKVQGTSKEVHKISASDQFKLVSNAAI